MATFSGVSCGDLLDLHAAGDAGDAEEGAVGAVQQVREVVLLGDVGGLGEHHLVDGVALDVHAEDVGRAGLRLVGAVGELDAAGLAAAADLHLGLDDHPAAEPLGDRAGLLRGLGDAAGQHGQAVPVEQIAPLVLVQVHVSTRPVARSSAARPVARRAASPVYDGRQPSSHDRAATGNPAGCTRCAARHKVGAASGLAGNFSRCRA